MSTSLLPESSPMNDAEIPLPQKGGFILDKGHPRPKHLSVCAVRDEGTKIDLKNLAASLAPPAICKIPWLVWSPPTKARSPPPSFPTGPF